MRGEVTARVLERRDRELRVEVDDPRLEDVVGEEQIAEPRHPVLTVERVEIAMHAREDELARHPGHRPASGTLERVARRCHAEPERCRVDTGDREREDAAAGEHGAVFAEQLRGEDRRIDHDRVGVLGRDRCAQRRQLRTGGSDEAIRQSFVYGAAPPRPFTRVELVEDVGIARECDRLRAECTDSVAESRARENADTMIPRRERAHDVEDRCDVGLRGTDADEDGRHARLLRSDSP